MAHYRKKPVEIEAIKFTGDNYDEVFEFIEYPNEGHPGDWFVIETNEGPMKCRIGDYIIKEPYDADRQFYPCKPDIFEKTYEKIE